MIVSLAAVHVFQEKLWPKVTYLFERADDAAAAFQFLGLNGEPTAESFRWCAYHKGIHHIQAFTVCRVLIGSLVHLLHLLAGQCSDLQAESELLQASCLTVSLQPGKKKHMAKWVTAGCVAVLPIELIAHCAHSRERSVDPRNSTLTFHYPDSTTIDASSVQELSVQITHMGKSPLVIPCVMTGQCLQRALAWLNCVLAQTRSQMRARVAVDWRQVSSIRQREH